VYRLAGIKIMALDIAFKNGKTYTWNTGVTEDKYSLKQTWFKEGVEMVMAYGQEKEYIEQRFNNIPTYNSGGCIWTGEVATFIALNLSTEIFINQ